LQRTIDSLLNRACQVAAFDFDGCLAKTSFGGGPDDWKMMFPSVSPTLSRLHAEGKRIVVVTNESLDRLKKPEAIARAVGNKLGRIQGFASAVGVPMLVLCATAKDGYRKPEPGSWAHLVECNSGVSVDKSKSFFVGDAAGRNVCAREEDEAGEHAHTIHTRHRHRPTPRKRPCILLAPPYCSEPDLTPPPPPLQKDHSDVDLKFAQAVGLAFHTEDAFFRK